MKIVEIYKLQNGGSQNIIATCKLVDDKVICEGNNIFIANLEQYGISGYKEDSALTLYPKDGIKFLRNLVFAFRSGYLVASDIKDI